MVKAIHVTAKPSSYIRYSNGKTRSIAPGLDGDCTTELRGTNEDGYFFTRYGVRELFIYAGKIEHIETWNVRYK